MFGAAATLPARTRAQTGPRSAAVALPARGELLIRGATILTMDPAVPDLAAGDVHVRGGIIVAIAQKIEAPAAQVIDGAGMICLPGFIDTHLHLWNSMFRLFVRADVPALGYFPVTARLGPFMTPEDSYRSVRFGASEALAAGVTTVHNWAHNTRSPDHADAELSAMRDMGIRGRLAYGTPVGLADDAPMDFAGLARVKKDWMPDKEGLLTLGISSRNLGALTIGAAAAAASRGVLTVEQIKRDWDGARALGVPITMHTSGASPITELEKAALLGPDVQLVHPLLTTPEERAILKARGVSYSISPQLEARRGAQLGEIQLGELLETGVKVIDLTTNPKSKHSKGDAQLAKEAKKDLVRTYAQFGVPEKAWPLFQKYGKDYAPTMHELLADLYNAQGKFADSIKVYRELIKLNPGTTKLCNWQTEILKNTLSMTGSRAVPETVKELQRLSAVYERTVGMPGVKKEIVDECRDNTSGSLRELATTWHKEAQKTGVKETYDLAQYLYREYLKNFPKEKDIYDMTFYYGELLFKLEKFCDAAPIYTDIVKMDTEGKHTQKIDNKIVKARDEAAYAAVISWKNCLNVDDSGSAEKQATEETRKKKGGKITAEEKKRQEKEKEEEIANKYKPQEIPEKWRKMLEAFDTYIQYVPNAPELVTIKYRRARVYYEYNHFEDAIPLFRDIGEHHPNDDLALYSVNLLFDAENILGKYDQLEEDSKRFCVIPDLTKDPDFNKQCAIISNGIARKKIEMWEKEGKYRLAADMYIKLATEHPDDPRIAELYYNAGIDYERAKAIGLAIKTRSDLIKLKPDDVLSKKSIFLVGRAYQDIAAYDKAADQYEVFANKYPGEKDAKSKIDASTALYTASFYRLGLGEIDKAIQDTNDFIKLYGTRKEYEDKSAGVFFGLYRIYETQGDKVKLEKHFREYLKTWGARGGVDREIIATVKLGELLWQQSCPVPGVNGACVTVERIRASSATKELEKAQKKKKGKKGKAAKEHFVIPKQCGPETKTKVTLSDRKPPQAKEAQTLFAKAITLYANGAATKKIPGDESDKVVRGELMMYAVAEAKMMQGDEQYEKLLALKVPGNLDFTPVDPYSAKAKQEKDKKRLADSTKRFTDWLTGKGKQIDTTQKLYQAVILYKQAHWAIAAAARIGQVFQDFSGQLFTAPIPKAPPPPQGIDADEFNQNFVDAYCDAMTDKAEPLETKAIEGLRTCLDKSKDLSWFNEWSKLCEEELNQIKPAEYPLASEIRAQPGYFDKRPDSAPLISEIK